MSKKKRKTVQVTITVPRSLRFDMLDYGNRFRVNWSRIACRAFADYLDKHNISRKGLF